MGANKSMTCINNLLYKCLKVFHPYCVLTTESANFHDKIGNLIFVTISGVVYNVVLGVYNFIYFRITYSIKDFDPELVKKHKSGLYSCMFIVMALLVFWSPVFVLFGLAFNVPVTPTLDTFSLSMQTMDGIATPVILIVSQSRYRRAFEAHILGRKDVKATDQAPSIPRSHYSKEVSDEAIPV